MVPIDLMKNHTTLTNAAIGDLFGVISYSAVSQAYRRCTQRMKEQPALRKRVESIQMHLSHVKV